MRVGFLPDLPERQVNIWTLDTRVSNDVTAQFEEVLAPDESERAAQFRADHQRESYILARGVVRFLLGYYLAVDPRSIRFAYGPNGKAALVPPDSVQFNVTHSADMAAIALARGCDVGIDLEQIRPLKELEQIADRFLCAKEAAEINSLPPGEREKAFFSCWTRKEAYVKAIGAGLEKPLKSFRIAETAGSAGELELYDEEGTSSEPWTIQDIHLMPGWTGAVAYRDRERSLSISTITDLAQFFTAMQAAMRTR
jgi:4'-phosphopantetheinyl transferase